MRLIDADALIKKFKHAKKGVKLGPMDIYAKGTLAGLDYAIYLINNVTTAEERKHGHWITVITTLPHHRCSVCNRAALCSEFTDVDVLSDYCPSCGAVMDEEVK